MNYELDSLFKLTSYYFIINSVDNYVLMSRNIKIQINRKFSAQYVMHCRENNIVFILTYLFDSLHNTPEINFTHLCNYFSTVNFIIKNSFAVIYMVCLILYFKLSCIKWSRIFVIYYSFFFLSVFVTNLVPVQ